MSKPLARILEAAVLVGAIATIPLMFLAEEYPAAKWVQLV
jgi:hypothetical protein